MGTFLENFLAMYFLLSLYLLSKRISYIYFKNKNQLNIILSFFLIIILTTYIIYLSILIGIYQNFISYLLILLIFLIPLFLIEDLRKIKFIDLFKNKLLIIFIPIFLISMLPASDPDSLDYHLGVAKSWMLAGNIEQNSNWLHYRLGSYGEIINIFSILFFGSKLLAILKAFSSFVIVNYFYENYKNYKNLNIFIIGFISSPIFIFFIASQKPQFFGYLLLIFSLIYLIKKKFNIIIILILAYVSAIKFSFIPVVLLIYLFLLIEYKNFFKKISIYIFIFSVMFWLPILIKNFYFYQNPLSPFFENLLNDNPNMIIYNFAEMLRNYGDIYSSTYLQILNIIIPFKSSSFTTTLGVGFLLILFVDYKKTINKKLILLALILIIFNYTLGQFSNRYIYLSYFLILFCYLNSKSGKFKNIINLSIYSQFFFVYSIILFFLITNFFSLLFTDSSNNFLKKYAYQFNETQWLNENIKDEVYSSDIRAKSLLTSNHFTHEFIYYLDKENFNQNFLIFLKEKNITKISLLQDDSLIYKRFANCKKNVKVQEFLLSKRNFLSKKERYFREIFDLDLNNQNCNIK